MAVLLAGVAAVGVNSRGICRMADSPPCLSIMELACAAFARPMYKDQNDTPPLRGCLAGWAAGCGARGFGSCVQNSVRKGVFRSCVQNLGGIHSAAIGIARSDHRAVLVHDAAEANAESLVSKALVLVAVGAVGVLVAVEGATSLHVASQLVDGVESVRMTAWRFMRDQDVGLLIGQVSPVGLENRAAMLEWDAAVPSVAFAAPTQKFLWAFVGRCTWRPPDLPAENAAESGHTKAGDLRHSAMQVPVSEMGSKQIFVINVGIGVVVAMDPPDLGFVHDLGQLDMQRALGLDVAEKHHCIGLVALDRFDHVAHAAMDITAKVDGPFVH